MPINVDRIMYAIVILIVIAIGSFVFYVVISSLPSQPKEISSDVISSPNQLFGIVGIVVIVGVALGVLGYVSRIFITSGTEEFSNDSVSTSEVNQTKEKTNEEIEKENRQGQLQIVHEKYFKGRTSRVGRAIKYIEENNVDV